MFEYRLVFLMWVNLKMTTCVLSSALLDLEKWANLATGTSQMMYPNHETITRGELIWYIVNVERTHASEYAQGVVDLLTGPQINIAIASIRLGNRIGVVMRDLGGVVTTSQLLAVDGALRDEYMRLMDMDREVVMAWFPYSLDATRRSATASSSNHIIAHSSSDEEDGDGDSGD